MSENDEYIGYLKYEGELVSDGYLDARKSAEALIGFDEALRYFVGKQSVVLSKTEYEIPVRIEKGSWIALIPHTISGWVVTALGVGATAYVATAATKMAEHDFQDVGIRTVFQKALQAIQWLIRIGKHMGTLSRQTFQNTKWRNNNEEIGIPNQSGDYLYVPKLFFDLYTSAPPSLLAGITRVVLEERTMVIAVHGHEGDTTEKVGYADKGIFCVDEDETLFPELEHGMVVSLEGLVTRGNENANSIGFQYNDHILTCYPMSGSVVSNKDALFVNCQIKGIITRANRLGEPVEPRPKIVFTDLIPLDTIPSEPVLGLLDDEK